MKVLILNGSPRMEGNTSIATREMVQVFEKEGVEAEVVQSEIRVCAAASHVVIASRRENVSLMMWSIHWLRNLKRRTDWLLQVRYTMRQQMRH